MPSTRRSTSFATLRKPFTFGGKAHGHLWSLPALARRMPNVARLPVSLRIVLESVLRHAGHGDVTAAHVEQLANWRPDAPRTNEIPFTVARVVLQDFTGVPLLADLAAMRSAAARLGRDARAIEPRVPVDLVVDHSVMVDHYGSPQALDLNMQLEFLRNRERYAFLKWGMQAFEKFKVVPPGFGIVHQINLEVLARGVHRSGRGADAVWYPDTLVGTDSHTTMINGIGVVGWGVGGIEAEAAMLGQPVSFLEPDVVGFEFTGRLREGVTATDLVLTVTERLRQAKVVGKFVEFFGDGAAQLAVPDRATIANMAPEYGATMGFFPVDARTVDYLRETGRTKAELDAFEAWFKAQRLFGMPARGEVDYSEVVTLDLSTVAPSLAGPKRPQDRIELGAVAATFDRLLTAPGDAQGFAVPDDRARQRVVVGELSSQPVARPSPVPDAPTVPPGAPRSVVEMNANRSTLRAAEAKAPVIDSAVVADDGGVLTLGHGDVLIAAITSCTNTSNPSVMVAAGLLAKKAVAAGLKVAPHIKTSLAPGSRVVTDYLGRAGLLEPLAQLGFAVAGYGCTTCIGNAGDLADDLNEAIARHDLVCAAVLSGNRNFEARIHPNLKANFLASPPLVVAYAIAGSVRTDLMTQPLGRGKDGREVWLGDVWPSSDEVHAVLKRAQRPADYRANHARVASEPGELWSRIEGAQGVVYGWPASTYIAEPPFFERFTLQQDAADAARDASVRGARVLALFGDSITTDHISPAGSIKEASPAGQWLRAQGVEPAAFNSYGARRGHHEVMMRGTFANVRVKNLMLPPRPDGTRVEGGLTQHHPSGETLSIYDAAMRYVADGVPTVVFAGEEYGTGSSRDWAAKGTALLGVKAVVASSFERIHRANLVGMGVLPLQFEAGTTWQSLALGGDETVDVVVDDLAPRGRATLRVTRADGTTHEAPLRLRIDTPGEVETFRAGGVLPYVLRQLVG